MICVAVDLGTTNIKAAAYTESLQRVALVQKGVVYRRTENQVEFDAEDYFETVFNMICGVAKAAIPAEKKERLHIVLTGQAESFVLLDRHMAPLGNAVSWMDMRAGAECISIREHFPEQSGFEITGEPAPSPAWPAAKLLWFRRNAPELFAKIRYVLLVKDYVQYRLTGALAGEVSTRGFTYFSISIKRPIGRKCCNFVVFQNRSCRRWCLAAQCWAKSGHRFAAGFPGAPER